MNDLGFNQSVGVLTLFAFVQGYLPLSLSPPGFHFSHLIRNCNNGNLNTSGPLGPEDRDSEPVSSVSLSFPLIYSLLCLELMPSFSLFFATLAHLAGNLFAHSKT